MTMRLSVTVREASQSLGIGQTNFYKLVRSGKIRTFKIGRRTLILTEELSRFVADAQQD